MIDFTKDELPKKNNIRLANLFLDEFDPETHHGSLVRIAGHQRVLRPRFLEVLDNDHGLANRSRAMDEHRNLLVNRVVLQKQGAFVGEVFLNVIKWYALELQCPYDSAAVWTRPKSMQLHSIHVSQERDNTALCFCELNLKGV